MFAISTAGIPRINSYTDALRYHDRAAQMPWRNGGEDYPFPEKRARQYGVRKTSGEGSIVFRLHSTDVVTWHPDNSITIEVYTSHSTAAFADCLLPSGIHTGGGMTRLVVGDGSTRKVYPIAGTVRIAPDHETIDTPVVWEKRRVDRKVAKAVLAQTNYVEYREWWQLMTAMTKPTLKFHPYWLDWDKVEALADRNRWHDLMCTWSGGSPDQVRQAIYNRTSEPVYYYEHFDYVIGYNATKTCNAVPK
jgi:hypothetical protein